MQGDPYYSTARYPGACAAKGCEEPIGKGDRVFIYPGNRRRGRKARLYAVPCGHAEANERDFLALAQDEAVYNGGW